MNNSELSAEIARRLPRFTQRDIREVLEVLTELSYIELRKFNGEIHLTGLGKLYAETHMVKCRGVTQKVLRAKYGKQAPEMLLRRTVRFRPSEALRTSLKREEIEPR